MPTLVSTPDSSADAGAGADSAEEIGLDGLANLGDQLLISLVDGTCVADPLDRLGSGLSAVLAESQLDGLSQFSLSFGERDDLALADLLGKSDVFPPVDLNQGTGSHGSHVGDTQDGLQGLDVVRDTGCKVDRDRRSKVRRPVLILRIISTFDRIEHSQVDKVSVSIHDLFSFVYSRSII